MSFPWSTHSPRRMWQSALFFVVLVATCIAQKQEKDKMRSVLMRSDTRMELEKAPLIEKQSHQADFNQYVAEIRGERAVGAEMMRTLRKDFLLWKKDTKGFESLASISSLEKLQALRMNSAAIAKANPEASATIAQVLVLTLADASGQASRAKPLLDLLSGSTPVKTVQGINYHDYTTEDEEMKQTQIPMDPSWISQWQTGADIGQGPIHQGQDLEEFAADGTLACVLGHHHMWEMAAGLENPDEGSDRAWTVIFEDDARPNHGRQRDQPLMTSIAEVLRSTPREAEIVMLGARHCEHRHGLIGREINRWAPGSMAYAITAKAAKALLAEPFIHASDHWLNVPVEKGEFQMFCPQSPAIFSHAYKHSTFIHDEAHFKGEDVQVASSM